MSASADKKAHILLVENNPDEQEVLQRILMGRGYDVTFAHHGKLALQEIAKLAEKGERFDMILSDCNMPQMDGPEMVEELAVRGKDDEYYNIPVMLMSKTTLRETPKFLDVYEQATARNPHEAGWVSGFVDKSGIDSEWQLCINRTIERKSLNIPLSHKQPNASVDQPSVFGRPNECEWEAGL